MVAASSPPGGEEDNHGGFREWLGCAARGHRRCVQPSAEAAAADRRRSTLDMFSTVATVIAALSWTPIVVSGLSVLLALPADVGHGYEVLGLAIAVYYTGPVACGLTFIVALLRYWRYRGLGSVVAGTATAAGLIISVFVWPVVVLPGW